MVDRKMLKNPNGLIFGTPGSGKSFAAKREIANDVDCTTNFCDAGREGELIFRLVCDKVGCMYPFVVRRYEGDYENIIDEVSISINSLRNGVAHSRLDLELEPRHLTDIKFVEELLYVIRLKSLGIGEIIIQKAINQLFHENLAI